MRARFAACDARLVDSAKEKFGVVTPFGGPTSSGMLTLHCPPAQVYALTSFLRENGAEAVAVADLDYVFSRDNPLYAKLEAGLCRSRLPPVGNEGDHRPRAVSEGGVGFGAPNRRWRRAAGAPAIRRERAVEGRSFTNARSVCVQAGPNRADAPSTA